MKTKNILLLGGIGAAAFYVVSTIKSTFNNLVFGFKKVAIGGFKVKTMSLGINLDCEIQNNSGQAVTIQWYKGKLWYGDFLLGDIVINETALAVGETKALRINLSLRVLSLASEIFRIIESKWFLYQFRTKGVLIFKVGALPQMTVNIDQIIPLAAPSQIDEA